MLTLAAAVPGGSTPRQTSAGKMAKRARAAARPVRQPQPPTAARAARVTRAAVRQRLAQVCLAQPQTSARHAARPPKQARLCCLAPPQCKTSGLASAGHCSQRTVEKWAGAARTRTSRSSASSSLRSLASDAGRGGSGGGPPAVPCIRAKCWRGGAHACAMPLLEAHALPRAAYGRARIKRCHVIGRTC